MSEQTAIRFARVDDLDHSHREGYISAAHQHIALALLFCVYTGVNI